MSADPPPAPPTAARGGWLFDVAWLLLLAGWSAAWCLTAAPRIGTTYDETFYLHFGLLGWREHTAEYTARNGVMPLPIDAATLPLYEREKKDGKPIGEPYSVMENLRPARAVTLLWLWLLILSGYRLGRAAGGPWAGRLAGGLLATDPNLLGHSALATTDICATATLMAFTRAVYAGRGGGWWKRITLPGLWFGVAVLSKLSALLYGGIILVALETAHRFASGAAGRPPGAGLGGWVRSLFMAALRSALAIATVIVIGVAIAYTYCGMPKEGTRPMEYISRTIPQTHRYATLYRELADKYDPVPLAIVAFAFQWWHQDEPSASYLNGTFRIEGHRYFFAKVLAMKTPLPVYLLLAAALLRPRAFANPLMLTALALLAVVADARVQIGVRLAFPVLATSYVAVAIAVGRGYPRAAPWIGVPALVAMAATSVWVWPHGVAYLNQPSGGLSAAPERVADSNLDWGQWMPDLVRWHAANGEPPIVLWYFGTDPVADQPPFSQIRPETLPIASGVDLRNAVGPRILAVGSTVQALHTHHPPSKVAALAYLKTRQPLLRHPLFTLYDFRDPNGPPALP